MTRTDSVSEKLNSKLAVLLLGPTGVAAANIDGVTVHPSLHIPQDRRMLQELSGAFARNFCDKLENVKFLVLDEYSMCGAEMLNMIDQRCRQGTGKNEPFAGLFTYFLGDIRQLPPVKDTPLYSDSVHSKGIALLFEFQKVFFLKHCFRQQDPEFENLLDRVSIGDISIEDYNLLSQRFSFRVKDEKVFFSALHFFATKDKVHEFTYKRLEKANVPVAKIVDKHNNKTARKGSSEDAEGLQNVLYLANGCKIMLKQNLWVKIGLVNGAIGEVADIVYGENEGSPNDMPRIIMCKFPSFTGPGIGPENLVPISPMTKSWTKNHVSCTRKQFPIAVCYACSIHKSQGMTVEKNL
ncbi:ATP-dependent DNA helicase [Frankliniella fusca]|uniref:ATP-dependent DNA helicase n=1 Tax=Frankliniella fusca TaxID=407009 RepID=A0AAE1L9V0_9NEOP|nr:ATP-dependent DNA helicase [Frankliniella fusca]